MVELCLEFGLSVVTLNSPQISTLKARSCEIDVIEGPGFFREFFSGLLLQSAQALHACTTEVFFFFFFYPLS